MWYAFLLAALVAPALAQAVPLDLTVSFGLPQTLRLTNGREAFHEWRFDLNEIPPIPLDGHTLEVTVHFADELRIKAPVHPRQYSAAMLLGTTVLGPQPLVVTAAAGGLIDLDGLPYTAGVISASRSVIEGVLSLSFGILEPWDPPDPLTHAGMWWQTTLPDIPGATLADARSLFVVNLRASYGTARIGPFVAPEPSTGLLLVLALGTLAFSRRGYGWRSTHAE